MLVQASMQRFRRLAGVALSSRLQRSASSAAAPTITGSVSELRSALDDENSAETNVRARVKGWIKSARHQKKLSFLEVVDGSSMQGLQVVVTVGDGFDPEDLKSVGTGTSVEVIGRMVPHPKHRNRCELHADGLEVLGECDALEYPLQKKFHSLDFLRNADMIHLRPRSNTIGAAARVRHHAFRAANDFLHNQDFFQVHCPIITKNDCEGAGELFSIESASYLHSLVEKKSDGKKNNTGAEKPFFPTGTFKEDKGSSGDASDGSQTSSLPHLTVSSQLEAEIYASALSRVYSFGPCFRAENSRTTRHLAEFWMLEPELAFTDLNGLMDLAEGCIQHVISDVIKNCGDELDFFGRTQDLDRAALEKVSTEKFARVTYTDAIAELQAENRRSPKRFEYNNIEWGIDMQSEHERYLAEEVYQGPVFVTDYPAMIKPFYMRRNEGTAPERETVACLDLLMPRVGEMIGGSMREERFDVLEDTMHRMGMNTSTLQWYLDLRRYGTVPHGGWGLGFDRLLMFITGLENIRDVVPFPRAANII